jgi:hypothetical protein
LKILEHIEAQGHQNILCTHSSTIELTKDLTLTLNGDCILGINSAKACADLSKSLIEYIQKGGKVLVEIKCEGIIDTFYGFGHKDLSLSHTNDIVFRKSDYKCNRTILINCTKSAYEIDRKLIEKLVHKQAKLQIVLKEFA